MANEIKAKFGTLVAMTITMNGIANGAGRVSTQVDNSTVRATRGLLGVTIKMGTTPTANSVIKLYLIRATTNVQDGRVANASALGTADAGVATEPLNAECIGTIQVPATAAALSSAVFPIENPGPNFSVVLWNATGATTEATGTGNVMEWLPETDEVQ